MDWETAGLVGTLTLRRCLHAGTLLTTIGSSLRRTGEDEASLKKFRLCSQMRLRSRSQSYVARAFGQKGTCVDILADVAQNMGMNMPGWYDIKSLSTLDDREEDEMGITKSLEYTHGLIEQEIAKGIPADRIVIGGFSQGGAMSLLSGVTSKNKLGGIVGLSCYLLLRKTIKDRIPTDNPNQNVPIFMGHGDADAVVAHKWGKLSAEELEKHGYKVEFRTYKYVDTTCPRGFCLTIMQGHGSLGRS